MEGMGNAVEIKVHVHKLKGRERALTNYARSFHNLYCELRHG